MASDDVEIGIHAEQLRVVAHSDNRYQAIDELAWGLPSAATQPVELGGTLMVPRTIAGKKVMAMEKTP